MDATRRLAIGARNLDLPGRIPSLLLLRVAAVLLLIAALTAGALASDPGKVASGVDPVAATASPGRRDSAKSAAPTRRKRSVFVCDDGGIPVYSDRPCGPELLRRSISIEQPGAGQVASTLPPAPKASTRPRIRNADRSDDASHAAERCRLLHRQLGELDDRMRTGYSSREAAKLWDRRRDLKDKLRSAGC
jgi:hypothetical protein